MRRRPVGAISLHPFPTSHPETPPPPSSLPLSSLRRLTHKRLSQPCFPEPEKAEGTGSSVMQMETRESSSEGSSVLVDQEVIHAAIRKCEDTSKNTRKRGCWQLPPSIVTTHSLVHPPASLYPTGLNHYSSIKAIIAANQPRNLRSPDGLMLSPRLKGKNRVAVVKCGCDPKPETIHSRGRVRSFQMQVAAGKQILPLRKRGKSKEKMKEELGGQKGDGRKLVATKGERVITMSKSSKLLKCFSNSSAWLLKH